MGCNCKKTKRTFKKYSDSEITSSELRGRSNFSLVNALKTILLYINQFVLGLVASALVIILIVPMILYLIVCLLFGLRPHIVVKLPKDWFNSHNKDKKSD